MTGAHIAFYTDKRTVVDV